MTGGYGDATTNYARMSVEKRGDSPQAVSLAFSRPKMMVSHNRRRARHPEYGFQRRSAFLAGFVAQQPSMC
jgi:hypothetical protein